jgi:septum site-determining protein MinC
MVVAVVPPPSTPAVFELKSANLSLVSVVLKTADLGALTQAMQSRFGDAPGLFDNDPVAIDLSHLSDLAEPLDFAALIELLRSHRMLPIAAKSGTPAQMEAALASGLSEAQPPVVPRNVPVLVEAVTLPEPPPPRSTLVVDKPLRSGQRVYARGADLVVLGVVSHGAEVIADGNIHVYAPLRGRALAGAMGDTNARIFATCMEPQLLSIAGIYRTTDTELAAEVLGKPAQVRLDDDKLVVLPLAID